MRGVQWDGGSRGTREGRRCSSGSGTTQSSSRHCWPSSWPAGLHSTGTRSRMRRRPRPLDPVPVRGFSSMRRLKVIVASPDAALLSRVASLLANRGHDVVGRCSTSIEALEACFDETADLAVLDDRLSTVRGSEIAKVLTDIESSVAAIVVHEGNGTLADESLLVLDPGRGGFEAAL